MMLQAAATSMFRIKSLSACQHCKRVDPTERVSASRGHRDVFAGLPRLEPTVLRFGCADDNLRQEIQRGSERCCAPTDHYAFVCGVLSDTNGRLRGTTMIFPSIKARNEKITRLSRPCKSIKGKIPKIQGTAPITMLSDLISSTPWHGDVETLNLIGDLTVVATILVARESCVITVFFSVCNTSTRPYRYAHHAP